MALKSLVPPSLDLLASAPADILFGYISSSHNIAPPYLPQTWPLVRTPISDFCSDQSSFLFLVRDVVAQDLLQRAVKMCCARNNYEETLKPQIQSSAPQLQLRLCLLLWRSRFSLCATNSWGADHSYPVTTMGNQSIVCDFFLGGMLPSCSAFAKSRQIAQSHSWS